MTRKEFLKRAIKTCHPKEQLIIEQAIRDF